MGHTLASSVPGLYSLSFPNCYPVFLLEMACQLNLFKVFLPWKRQGKKSSKGLFEKWEMKGWGRNWLCRTNLGPTIEERRKSAQLKVHSGLGDTVWAAVKSHGNSFPTASGLFCTIHISWNPKRSSTYGVLGIIWCSLGTLQLTGPIHSGSHLCHTLHPISTRTVD